MPTITPYEFVIKYRQLNVTYESRSEWIADHPIATDLEPQIITSSIYMWKYFMMKWEEGSDELKEYHLVAGKAHGGKSKDSQAKAQKANEWYALHKENIKTAAMGKGSPEDYRLALEWAIKSGKIPNPNTDTVQDYCFKHLGLECSGFATNYLVASGKREYSAELLRNTNAASYYDPALAINDSAAILQGDLLVWMKGAKAKTGPGHIAVVDTPPSTAEPKKMRVCEATGHAHARPHILGSWYDILDVTPKGDKHLHNKVMILKVKRHGTSGDHVCVIRPTAT
jgi:hypothetical protein